MRAGSPTKMHKISLQKAATARRKEASQLDSGAARADGLRIPYFKFDRTRYPNIVSPNTNSQSPVEPTKRTGQHDRHDQDARTEHQHVPSVSEIKVDRKSV